MYIYYSSLYLSHWIFKILQKNQENIKEQKQKVLHENDGSEVKNWPAM